MPLRTYDSINATTQVNGIQMVKAIAQLLTAAIAFQLHLEAIKETNGSCLAQVI